MELLSRRAKQFAQSVVAKKQSVFLVCGLLLTIFFMASCEEQNSGFSGFGMGLGNLPRMSSAITRSISPENFTGEKGKGGMATEGTGARAARELGQTWKVSPSVRINPGQTFVMANVEGCGAIQHIWMTPTGNNRFNILRIYWDGEQEPSVECPAGDFFACGMWEYVAVNSLAVCVNPKSGFNCYWTMPFRKSFKMTMTNIDEKPMVLYYQIDYTFTDVPKDAAYFHAQFRRTNPLPNKQDYTILDGVRGKGQYVGTYMVWGSNSPGWWGEGEIKFFMDGDKKFPTICGTGTEDYFCGSYGFSKFKGRGYQEFSTAYTGMPQVMESETKPRFGLYRWHILDPIRFEEDLKVMIQALGWQSEGRYLPLKDDLSSVAYWYQTEPHAKFPKLPGKEILRH
jgi:hypothetical protein